MSQLFRPGSWLSSLISCLIRTPHPLHQTILMTLPPTQAIHGYDPCSNHHRLLLDSCTSLLTSLPVSSALLPSLTSRAAEEFFEYPSQFEPLLFLELSNDPVLYHIKGGILTTATECLWDPASMLFLDLTLYSPLHLSLL